MATAGIAASLSAALMALPALGVPAVTIRATRPHPAFSTAAFTQSFDDIRHSLGPASLADKPLPLNFLFSQLCPCLNLNTSRPTVIHYINLHRHSSHTLYISSSQVQFRQNILLAPSNNLHSLRLLLSYIPISIRNNHFLSYCLPVTLICRCLFLLDYI